MKNYHTPKATFVEGTFADVVAEVDTAGVESVLTMDSEEMRIGGITEQIGGVDEVERTSSNITENPFAEEAVEPPFPADSFGMTVLTNPVNCPYKRDYPLRVATSVTVPGGTIIYRDETSLAESAAAELEAVYAIRNGNLGDIVTAAVFTATHAGSMSAGTAVDTQQQATLPTAEAGDAV